LSATTTIHQSTKPEIMLGDGLQSTIARSTFAAAGGSLHPSTLFLHPTSLGPPNYLLGGEQSI
jgi:hypothetical protein